MMISNLSFVDQGLAGSESPMKVKVKIILKKLSLEKQKKMRDFQDKVYKYIATYEWFNPKDLPPFDLNFQMVLQDLPSNIEDRYRASLLVAGPDIQYYDKRCVFAFQEGEEMEHDGQFTALKGIIDFYVYLVIANEYDKLGYLEGTPFLDKAKEVLQQGKFSRFFTGWDRREELLDLILGKNYQKFREMKDYYFYAMATLDEERDKAKQYIVQALKMLEEVLENDSDLDAARQFIDAHYQEVLDIFKNDEDKTAIEILKRIDPEREDVYNEYL
ncbi:MAG: DUF4835 family protein [candidate division KSB1 bacterium]|nr:DUF4835 family protein [candidate division KSB1 bacterium]